MDFKIMKDGILLFIAIMTVVIGGVTAHHNGIEQARRYTDAKVDKLEMKVDYIYQQLTEINAETRSIRTLIEERVP